MNAGRQASIRKALLGWYRRSARTLPWRSTTDPYAIWVSEIMLQQTQVATVLPYYERFLERFPTITALAAASEEEVLSAWSGLGYYRRARALLAGAKKMIREFKATVPVAVADLMSIPGVGRYTAGAVASIAYHQPEPVLDGNIRRVLARLTGGRIRGDRTGADEAACWELAGGLVEGPDPGDLNQSLMELGATVCTAAEPDCRSCPVMRWCEGYASGNPGEFPVPAKRAAGVKVLAAVAVIGRGDKVLLEKPGDRSPLRGLWDLPALEHRNGADGSAELAAHLLDRHGLEVRSLTPGEEVSHGIMNRRIRLTVYHGTLARGRVAGRKELCWVEPDRLDVTPVSGATLKVLRAVLP
ncbi:MAG: A/G-specific adenine glycosylase [Acidobacteria bacterium]|uniref:Adenine DNA glycosylase n=1 Tax=Candidatus Polarisedimenticola svalbardensis TaxID=2886004 RepID=A0A8J7CCX7_9BACT|nr:A/G-specific adenine glycosylase [Candidatus Polarisedimenticola svalbardensis]